MRGRPRSTEDPPKLVSGSDGNKEKNHSPADQFGNLELKDLPQGVRENLDRIRTLDEESIKLEHEAAMGERDAYSFLTSQPSPPLQERENVAERVRNKRLCVGELHKQKAVLATAAYDMIDDFVRRLDSDIMRLDAEMRRVGGKTNVGDRGGKKKHYKQRGQDKKASADDKRGSTDALEATELIEDTVTSLHQDAPIDPNEPVYCVCRRVSFGEMVGCDNNECRYEWFHFECVGIDKQPEGEWFCPDCRTEDFQDSTLL